MRHGEHNQIQNKVERAYNDKTHIDVNTFSRYEDVPNFLSWTASKDLKE
jgi:hypothetical protein